MTEQDTTAPSIEQAQGDDVLGQLKGIRTALKKLPIAPTEVVGFILDPTSGGLLTNKQSTHVKINITHVLISGDNFAGAATVSFNIGGRSFPLTFDGSVPFPINLPVKWDRGVDAWFSCDVAQTAFNCYVLGTVE